jgi:hypothetical protein
MRAVYAKDAIRVPAAIDEAILREARAGFARRRRFRIAVRVTVATAAAASIVLGIILPAIQQTDHGRGPVASAPKMLSVVPAAEDVDHSGRVDILDAFVVAKLIDTRAKLDAAYDVNGDGKVDAADVDRIAVAAVSVSTTTAKGDVQRESLPC